MPMQTAYRETRTCTLEPRWGGGGGVSENSLPESLTASCHGDAGLPVGAACRSGRLRMLWGRETGHRVYGQQLDGLIGT